MYKVEFVKLHRRFEFLLPAKMKRKSGITVLYQMLLKVACNVEFHPISECFYSGWKFGFIYFLQVNNMGRKEKKITIFK